MSVYYQPQKHRVDFGLMIVLIIMLDQIRLRICDNEFEWTRTFRKTATKATHLSRSHPPYGTWVVNISEATLQMNEEPREISQVLQSGGFMQLRRWKLNPTCG